MNIILNEKVYIEDIIKQKDLGSSPVQTLNMVARYYHSLSYKPKAIREELEHFLLRCDPNANLVKWSDVIDRAVSKAKKPLIEIDSISITKKELKTCYDAGGKKLRRIAFTMLCLAKYYNNVYDTDGGWVNTPMAEIFSLANVCLSRKEQAIAINKMVSSELLGLSKRIDSTNVCVKYVDQDGEPELYVYDFRNLGFQYERYRYGIKNYPQCELCGQVFKDVTVNTKHRKYCPKCAREMKAMQTFESDVRRKKSGIYATS